MSTTDYNLIEVDGAPVYFIDDVNSDDEQSDPELYSSSSTSSGSADTLSSFEIHDYFQEIQGRMFPADDNVAISLPQDSAEVQRSRNHHIIFKMILRSNYWGPVEQVLAPIPGERERKKVLDMVTAEGSWVQEMAQQFPHVDFLSVDNVPLTSHMPRPNIEFEVYDIFNGIAAPDESFDLVHIRQSTAHIRNPKDLIRDIHRVLKPGGLLLFVDSELDVFDGMNPKFSAGDTFPGLDAALRVVRRSLEQQGVNVYLWRDLPKMLSPESELWVSRRGMNQQKQPGFRNIRHKAHLFPANGSLPSEMYYKALGKLAGDTWKLMWRNMEIPFQIYGMDPVMAHQIVQGAVDDLDRTDRAVAAKTQTVYAFKI
ncbi:methyltransferase domain protein [Ceratobasidium sp. AG-Ba]|nr:methyltransferase domain protein [Ceratobasidium sp. AG-Ba]QRW09444.1 methyltransferase domain protein [Ceratobasidium sp. AG-Ba]